VVSNSDVSVTQECLDCCIGVLKNHNDIGAVAPTMKDPHNDSYSCRCIDLGYLRVLIRIIVSETFLDKHTERYCKMKDNLIYQSFLPGSLFIATSNALVKCKGFDEEIFLYREEEILGKRMLASGYKEAIVKNFSFIHHHNYKLENAKTKFNRLKLALQSECVYFKKYIKSKSVQLIYLYCAHKLYLYSRYLGWVLRDFMNSNHHNKHNR
jgi:GT2 family glycosyltransferase